MDHLSEAQIATLRAKLEAEAEKLRGRLSEATEALASTPAPDPQDIEDAAADEASSFRATQLRERERQRLAQLDAALARMEDGSYGICEDSDDEIPYRRLELEPTTRFTVEAQEQRERERGVADRHADEPVGY